MSLTSNIGVTTASLTLSAGDWDVQAVIAYAPAGSTIMGTGWAGVSTTTNTFGAYNSYTQTTHLNNSAGQGEVVTSPVVRISVASSTAVYAIAQSFFTTSTETAKGFIRARRVH